MVGEAIVSLLSGVTANVSPLVIPQEVDLPWVTYTIIDSDPQTTKSSYGDLDIFYIQIDTYHTSYSAAHDLAKEVRIALESKTGTYASEVIHQIYFDSERDLTEFEPEGTYRVSQDYTVWVKDIIPQYDDPLVSPNGTAYLLSAANAALQLKSTGAGVFVTVEFRYYYANTAAWGRRISIFEVQNNSDNYLSLWIENNAPDLIIFAECNNVGIGQTLLNFFDTIPGWYKIKIVWHDTSFTIYKNDVIVNNYTVEDLKNMVAAGATLTIMKGQSGTHYPIPSAHKLCSFKYTTESVLVVHYPICEESGNTVYNVVSNAYHLTGQSGFSSLTWSRSNNQEYYLGNYGYRKSGSVYIPALLSGASAADGNAITNTPPNVEFKT